jgi:hypothetical protein
MTAIKHETIGCAVAYILELVVDFKEKNVYAQMIQEVTEIVKYKFLYC